jgi:heat shock protein HtpX
MEKIRLSFYDEIRRNKIYSVILILATALILTGLIYVIGLAIGGLDIFLISIFAIIFSLIYILIGYYNSDKLALASVNARQINPSETRFRGYYNSVEGLCLASGMPMPKLYVMENPQINAFASGRDPKHSVICVTTGALEKLNKQELEGVLAHELSHIANYDIRFMTLVAGLVGMIAIISEIFLRTLWIRSSNNNEKGNAIFMIIGIVLAILAPIIVTIVQLAISRKREFGADASAVKFMRTPSGLIGALQKIKHNSEMKVSGAVAPLFLEKPSKAAELFSTHPPLEKRILRLKKM